TSLTYVRQLKLASPVTAVVLAAGISSQTKFPVARRAKNNSATFSRTTPLIASQSRHDQANGRDTVESADFVRPTMPSPAGHCLVPAIDTDLRQLRPDIWWKRVSLESVGLV